MVSSQPDPRDRQKFYYHATPFRRAAVALIDVLFKIVARREVVGLEHLPTNGPAVLAANHVTNFDVFPMQLCLPRPIFFMGKAELFRFPPLGAALRSLGAFPVNRGEKDQWALAHAARVLAHEQILGMFPEGTRSKGTGLRLAKTGTARLAIEAQCPIIPMAIVGSDRVLRDLPRRATMRVQLLPPIHPAPDDTALAITDRLMFALASALPETMRGVYAEFPPGFS